MCARVHVITINSQMIINFIKKTKPDLIGRGPSAPALILSNPIEQTLRLT